MRVNIQGTAKKKAEVAHGHIKDDIIMQKLKTASSSEIDAWIDGHTTNLATTRALLKKMMMVMSYLLNKGG